MSELNKSYRIRTNIGKENEFINIDENLVQDYDTFEILSVKINSKDAYRLHNSKHGIVVGRVLANNGFGIPNAKISIFIKIDGNESGDIATLYPFDSTFSKDKDGVPYNLLPNEKVDGCHQVVGTFPSKRYALDNDVILEVFDKYYKYTTKTNNSGDYLICGVPVGAHTLHMDLDLSDCGILSQKPRDFVYKGYTIEQFETPTKFKSGTDYENLSQIFRQDQVVNVKPFWGNESLGESIGITRADINVNFKFEPTCVFIGSIISDNSSNGFSRRCIATDHMGDMDELVTGEGKIEMIRKTPGGKIEEFSIKGNKLIDANGVWCYQIPMNLDYMVTDEYGNMVPTDNPEKGIPTRASVRFRISMEDHEENTENFFRSKVLVPHNPQNTYPYGHEKYDYEFGTYTRDDSFRDLFWNNVYSVKSYIPRIQKNRNPKNEKFSGIKHCNNFGPNNPMPYNNIRIKMPLMFTIVCALIKCFIFLTKITNTVIAFIGYILAWLCTNIRLPFFRFDNGQFSLWPGNWNLGMRCVFADTYNKRVRKLHLIVLKDGLCPDLENWYFAPCFIQDDRIFSYSGTCECTDWIGDWCETHSNEENLSGYNILSQTLEYILSDGEDDDPQSIDDQNDDEDDNGTCLTVHTDYLIACVEMNLAQEYKVINFDFYNDWVNGTIYLPRWVRYIKPKTRFLWITWSKEKVRGCMDDTKIFSKSRRYLQQCAIDYDRENLSEYTIINSVSKPDLSSHSKRVKANNLHKRRGLKHQKIFGNNGGICHQATTMKGQYVYYLKPCEWLENTGIKVNLFATDIILLGSFNDCDLNGIPQTFTHLASSTYVMPTNLALTNMDTNGPLYAKGDGTICIGDTPSTADTGSMLTAKVRQIDGSGLTLYGEGKFYSGTTNYDLNESGDYPNGIELDTIALTEAAGIAWNYTGPGQGGIDKEKMYYPGGHFLGISCVNAETNLKSCINLSRICEIGSTMSQRRESVRAIDENGKLKFTYTAPSGFISGDEIVDSDFRSMFATLNKKRLIATKRNPNTGYRFYDFDFTMPINFNGAFSKLTNGYPYNMSIATMEEDLTDLGITLGSDREDYDEDEANNTQIKTRESSSLDYYMYRFGLTYDQLQNISFQQKKFLRQPNPNDNPYVYYLPQYENSYYFYFGLKFGATALDEFNKQFYSECDNLIIKKSPNMILSSEVDFCKGTGKIHVFTEGLDTPYQSITIYNDLYSDPIYVIDGSREEHRTCLTSEVFVLINEVNGVITEDFEFGNYTITIVDSDGIEITKTIAIGVDMVSYSSYISNFNLPIDETGTTIQGSIWRGGYISISDLFIEGFELTDFDYIRFHLYERDNMSLPIYTGTYTGEELILYGFKKNIEYLLVIEYKCPGESSHTINLDIFTLYDNSDVRLKLGNKNYSIDCIYKNDAIMGMMSQSWWWDDSHRDIGGNDLNDLEAWYYKTMFFNRNKLKYTFDSNVFAENSKKVLWGTPQKYNDISSTTGCSEYPTEIQPGYSLDDKKSYYSTYGVDNCDFTPINWDEEEVIEFRSGHPGDEFYPNCIMHYCAQAYRGVNVCGPYRGTMVRNDDDTVEVSFSPEYFHNGYGCVFKPLPGGSLKYMIYDSTNLYENMVAEISGMDCNYGVFYPTFIYPVIKRPFYIVSDYIDHTERELIYAENSAFTRNFVKGYDVVAKINNGVTYDREFSQVSYITGLENEFPRRLTEYDWYGLTEGSSLNRVETISAHTIEELFSGETISYNVTELAPDEVFEQFTNYHEEVFKPGFCTQLGYTTKLDDQQVTCIDKIVKAGDAENSAVTYYLGIIETKPDNRLDFIKNGPDYIYVQHETIPNVYFAICRFIKGPGYAIRVSDGSDFSEVIVQIIIQMTGNGDGNVHIIFEYEDAYGTSRTYDETLRIQHNSNYSDFGSIDTIIDLLNYHNYNAGSGTWGNDNGYNLPLEGVKNGLVLDNPTYNGQAITWKEAVMKLGPYMHQGSYYESRYIPVCSTTGDCKMFGLGIATYLNEGNETKVYKIYKDVTKLDEEYVQWGDGSGTVWVSTSDLVINAAHNEVSFQVSASSPTVITLDLTGSSMDGYGQWYTISCPGSYEMNGKRMLDCLYPEVYTVTIVAIHNNTQQTRENEFKFSTTQNTGATEMVNFKQTGAVTPAKQIRVSLSEDDLNNGNYRLRVQAVQVNPTSWGDEYAQIDFKINGQYQEDWNTEPSNYDDMLIHDNIIVPGWNGISCEYHDIAHTTPELDTNYKEVIDSNSPNIINILIQ